jgi:hypothetical protein
MRISGERHAIICPDGLMKLFGLNRDEALRLYSEVIGPHEIAELLRTAGAPEPWANPAAPVMVGRVDDFLPADNPDEVAAQKAINQLRRALPKIIVERLCDLAPAFATPPPEGPLVILAPYMKRQLAALIQLREALSGVGDLVPSRKKGSRANWQHDALELFGVYRAVVDPNSGYSADGPAARFVQAALERLGAGKRELDAIASAIRTRSR